MMPKLQPQTLLIVTVGAGKPKRSGLSLFRAAGDAAA